LRCNMLHERHPQRHDDRALFQDMSQNYFL
jgi:hypothetical protein